MSDDTRDLLVRGIAAAKAKSKEEARHYLEWVIDAPDAEQDQIIEAWRYLAQVVDDPKDKRNCFEQVLAYDPTSAEARRGLAILNGALKPQDIVDPDHISAPATQDAQPAQARRFVCPRCGGKMAFTPDGNSLTCTYCGREQPLVDVTDGGGMIEEQDFTLALATAKGHSAPVATQSLRCQGCGASFMLPPQTLSQNCPYCASAYVVEQMETRELMPPEGVVPFAVTQAQAQQAVLDWYRTQGFRVLSNSAFPSGVYLPVWTFDVGGEITWNCLVEANEVWLPRSGSKLVYENDMLVAASHTLSAALTEEINAFPLDRLAPYDPGYVADWPAETYQISVGDASLVARWRILDKMRPQVEASITESYNNLRLSALRLAIESYKLILVPLWIAHYRYEKTWHTVVVNGQRGTVRGEKPRKGVSGWLSNLLGEPL